MFKDTMEYKNLMSAVRQVMEGKAEAAKEEIAEMSSKEKMKKGLYNGMDPVGQEDDDIDNDGDTDKSDEYLAKRRKAIKKAMKSEDKDLDADNVDKALKHDCATHVEHAEYGAGRCIPGMHTLVQVTEETGLVTHYDVMFEGEDGPFIVENIPVTEMKVTKEMNHGHKKKK